MPFCPAGIFGAQIFALSLQTGRTVLFLCCCVWADVLRARNFENDFEIPPHFRCGHCRTVLFVLLCLGFVLLCLGQCFACARLATLEIPHFRCGRCRTVLIVLLLVKFLLFRCWTTGSYMLSFYHDPFMCASVYRTEISEHGVDTLDCKDGWWERFLSK